MTIRFMCPNGHQLSAPDDRAGKAGQCPKCKADFLIPSLADFAGVDEPAEAPPPAPEKEKEKAEKPGSGIGSGKKTEQIVFLCPNGHKLNGPASLKGKPGKCPHCGAKFLIPGDEPAPPPPESELEPEPESAAAASAPPVPAMSLPVPSGSSSDLLTLPGQPALQDEEEEIPFGSLATTEVPLPIPPLPPTEEIVEVTNFVEPPAPAEAPASLLLGHELGRIAQQLWSHKEDGEVLELRLKDGQSAAAHFFSATLSQGNYAVIAESHEDGSYAIRAIPWDTVSQLSFRVAALPKELFR